MAKLYLIATPIGNLDDVSFRCLQTLREVDVLACEDTRRTRRLLSKYEIPVPEIIFSCHEHNEHQAVPRIISLVQQGRNVGQCTSAGYPGISDPGYRTVAEALEADIEFEVIPGPGAVEMALLLSGLPTSSFTFKGFPPRKKGKCSTFLAEDSQCTHTLIFFESPYRIAAFLGVALEVLGDRQAAVCLELSKKFERVQRGYLSDLFAVFEGKTVKGEATIVVAGNHPKFRRT